MKKIISMCLSLIVAMAAMAQGSWVEPQFPGAEMPAGADGSTTYYMCNVETGAFALAGMNWNTKAISQRLTNGDTQTSSVQQCKVSNSNGKLKIAINGKQFLGGGIGYSDLWVDHAQNNEWTPTQVAPGVYTLTNDGGDLDVAWKNGGPLTPNGGVGKTKWGFITEANITNGTYALYKAKVQLYGLYKACADAGCEEVYPEAFATALSAYNASNATAASIQSAYVTLFKAVYMAVNDNTEIDASPLFDNADMAASGNTNSWGNNNNIGWSVFERWHASNFKLTQTKTLPAGKYSATLHAFWRQDGSQAAPTFTIESGDNKSTKNVKAMSEVDFGTVAGNGGNFSNNKPNGMQSGGVAIAHGDLEYSTDFISVSDANPVTVTLSMPAGDQWLLWQDVKLTYKGMSDEGLIAMMADKISTAETLYSSTKMMDATVRTNLGTAISKATSTSRADILQAGPVLDAAIEAARTNVTEYENARASLATALERFETDYNDGANGPLRKMSVEAWNTLLDAVKVAALAKDYQDAAGNAITLEGMAQAATALQTAMDNSEPSITLYSKYELLMTALNRYNATLFPASDECLATDAMVEPEVEKLDAAWKEHLTTLEGEIAVSPLLGQNLDFEATEGNISHTPTGNGNHSYDQPNWDFKITNTGNSWTFAGQNADVYEGNTSGEHSLRVYSNWTNNGDILQYTQSTMLPTGSYRIEMSLKMVEKNWNDNLCYVEVGGTRYPLTAGKSWEKVNVNVELLEATPVTISLGHKAKGGSNKMDIYADDINLYITAKSAYERAHDAAVEAKAAAGTSESVALASALAEYEKATQAEATAAGYDIATATAVLKNAVAIAEAGDVATGLLKNADFTGGTSETNSGGKGMYPAEWTFTRDLEGWNDCNVNNGVFNMWAGTIKSAELKQQMTNLPDGIYEVSAEFSTNRFGGKSGIGIFADGTGTETGRSVDIGTYSDTEGIFVPYSAFVRVKGHKMNVGIYSNLGYYQTKNIQVKMLPDNEENSTKVTNSVMYQDICWSRGELEYDIAGNTRYTNASNADIRPMLNEPNALITAKDGQIKAGDNLIVDGVCDNLVLTDGAPFHTTKAFTATAATYTRTMPTYKDANDEDTDCTWGTVMLPYAVSSTADMQYYILTNVSEGESGWMHFTEVSELPANTPGVFIAGAKDAVMEGSGTVAASPEGLPTFNTTNAAAAWTLHGTLEKKVIDDVTTDTDNEYYYIANEKFWHATKKLTINPFRAYFTVPKAVGGSVRTFSLVVDESDPTAIRLVPTTDAEQTIYTLSGVRIQGKAENLKPGVYIINNKKTVVK